MTQPPWQAAVVAAIVFAVQLVAWLMAAMISAHHPALLPLCGLAYTFGIRHGLDADHIAAIDNASRDLIGRGIRPLGLGLYFALGHSGMVALGSLATAGIAIRFNRAFGHFRDLIATYSTLVSIALLLLVVPRNVTAAWHGYRQLRGGRPLPDEARGAFVHWLQWVTKRLGGLQMKTWHMFFVGALFGLGFETASAMAVLAMTGTQAAGGASWVCVMVFPLLFTAGMTLVDAADGVLMEFAYGWAVRWPRKHAIYNLAVTGISASAALIVGGLEVASLIRAPGRTGYGWCLVALLESHFDALGAGLVLILAATWVAALIRQRRRDRRELSWRARRIF